MTVRTKIKRIIEKNFMIKMPQPISRVNLSHDIHINPLEFLEMIFYVENEFKIELQDKDLQQIKTVGDLAQCVQKYSIQ